jgi:hypothetical protein
MPIYPQAVKARQVLEEQMAERQDMLREAESEAARERAMVDEVVRRIQEEDAANVALRKQKQVRGEGRNMLAAQGKNGCGWGV